MKVSFIGTFDELQQKLDRIINDNKIIKRVDYVSYLTVVDSMYSDNHVRVFIINYE